MRCPSITLSACCAVALLGSTGAKAQEDDLLDDLGPEADREAPASSEDESSATEEIEAAPEEAGDLEGDEDEAEEPGEKAPSESEVDARSLDRIKAVPKKALLKNHRIELSPLFALSINDAYYQHFSGSGSIIFYPHDAFGIGVSVDYLYAHVGTKNLEVVRQGHIAVPAVFEQPRLLGHLDLYWVPMYGKLSLFDTNIVHFDFYVVAGGGIATAFGSEVSPAANVGVGQRYVLADWLALRFELRDHLFVATQEVFGLGRSDIQSFVMFYAGASFFVPPSFEYSYQ